MRQSNQHSSGNELLNDHAGYLPDLRERKKIFASAVADDPRSKQNTPEPITQIMHAFQKAAVLIHGKIDPAFDDPERFRQTFVIAWIFLHDRSEHRAGALNETVPVVDPIIILRLILGIFQEKIDIFRAVFCDFVFLFRSHCVFEVPRAERETIHDMTARAVFRTEDIRS